MHFPLLKIFMVRKKTFHHAKKYKQFKKNDLFLKRKNKLNVISPKCYYIKWRAKSR